MRFRDRRAAGEELGAAVVAGPASFAEPIVLALPRGGVPVAAPVAAALEAPLDVIVARKVGAPGQPELGVGAIVEGGGFAVNTPVLHALDLGAEQLGQLAEAEQPELHRRVELYRGGRPLPDVAGRDVVVVDDGLATGVTAEAAVLALRARDPRRVVLAVPVGATATAERLRSIADEVLVLVERDDFRAVGDWYDDFSQTSDDEVLAILGR